MSWCCRRYTATATRKLPTCSASRSAPAKRSCTVVAACCASGWVCRRRPMNEFNKTRRDPLDEALASLPEDVAPQRDLWPQIRAEIEKTPIAAPTLANRAQSTWFRLAAGVVLVLGSSFVTYYITRESMQTRVVQV